MRVGGVSIEDRKTFVGIPNPGENHRTCQQDWSTGQPRGTSTSCILTCGATTSAPAADGIPTLTAYPALDQRRVALCRDRCRRRCPVP